jgi:hypothetical protein
VGAAQQAVIRQTRPGAATGYERGTITPFGAARAWPVVADTRVSGEITLGGGAHGVAVALDGAAAGNRDGSLRSGGVVRAVLHSAALSTDRSAALPPAPGPGPGLRGGGRIPARREQAGFCTNL